MLSPRGKVLEHGRHRFFKGLSEGVFNIKDLKFRAAELSKFFYNVSSNYYFGLGKTIAMGFPSDTNIGASNFC